MMREYYIASDCHCGKYGVDRCDYDDFLEGKEDKGQRFWKLSSLAREQTHSGRPPLFLDFSQSGRNAPPEMYSAQVDDLLRTRWPRTTSERLTRALANLCRRSTYLGEPFTVPRDDYSILFARSPDEGGSVLGFLMRLGYIAGNPQNVREIVRVTPEGWDKIEQQERTSPRNPAFVAMWFGNDEEQPNSEKLMRDAFAAIRDGIEAAGFKCAERIDVQEHNNDIMDRIKAAVREAPLVVADFTANRNGVYYEAGMGFGFGIPVIHCCRREDFDKAHFDIKQINTIQWDDPAELRGRIESRIRGSICAGPYDGAG